MMNIVQLQDQLKNFSQDQLIREMQAPSGNTPQYLVLGEIMRRKQMESAVDGQQAPQATVAEEAVAAAGVPQGGISDMARALAPQTDMAQNTGVQAMARGGPVKKMAAGDIVVRDGLQYVEQADGTLRLGDFQGLRILQQGLQSSRETAGSPAAGGAVADTGAFPTLEERFPSLTQEGGSDVPAAAAGPQGFKAQHLKDQPPYNPAEAALAAEEAQNVGDAYQQAADTMREAGIARLTGDTPAPAPANVVAAPAQPAPQGGVIGGIGGGGRGGALSPYEQQLMDAIAAREKAAKQDKWLALAQIGLSMMSSTQPTLLGAVGEAGLKGIEALRASRDKYDEDKLSLQAALAKARSARGAAVSRAAAGASTGASSSATGLGGLKMKDYLGQLKNASEVARGSLDLLTGGIDPSIAMSAAEAQGNLDLKLKIQTALKAALQSDQRYTTAVQGLGGATPAPVVEDELSFSVIE